MSSAEIESTNRRLAERELIEVEAEIASWKRLRSERVSSVLRVTVSSVTASSTRFKDGVFARKPRYETGSISHFALGQAP